MSQFRISAYVVCSINSEETEAQLIVSRKVFCLKKIN